LNQVHLAIHDSAQGELARAGSAGTGRLGHTDDSVKNERVSVGADLHYVLSGVGLRAAVENHDHVIDKLSVRSLPFAQNGLPVTERRGRL
jgi:hypothetical protein